MRNLADVSIKDLPEIFNQATIEIPFGTASIIEKDFWLVQVLRILYQDDSFSKNHVFKGGTSLSKCYQLIRRFSEDLDITINRSVLGIDKTFDEIADLGSKSRKRFFEGLAKLANSHVEQIMKRLDLSLKSAFDDLRWNLYIDSNDAQRIIIEYPKMLDIAVYSPDAYVAPRIILEFGCRGDTHPQIKRTVRTYVEEALPNIFTPSAISVNTLSAERTFWEKITLLHMLAHKPEEKLFQSHMARHYYDIYMLNQSKTAESALNDIELLDRVAAHKSVFFKSAQASYETAKRGTLKLIPSSKHLKELEADYQSMSEMFFEGGVPFDLLIDNISKLEESLNEN